MQFYLISSLALASGTNAFTFPHGATLSAGHAKNNHIVPSSSIPSGGKFGIKNLHPCTSSSSNIIALLAKKDNGTHMQGSRTSDRSLELYAAKTSMSEIAEVVNDAEEFPFSIGALAASALGLFSFVAFKLQLFLNKNMLDDGHVSDKYRLFADFFQDHQLLSFLLILTHAIPFALMPYTMKQIADKAPLIKKDHPEFNSFILQLAMATTTFGLALEFGWHVADSWYYDNSFHILNFGFYFFLISSFALWADGFKSNAKMDTVFGGILLLSTVLYPLGNGVECGAIDLNTLPSFLGFLENTGVAKIPLYIGMTVTFVSLTIRGTEVFGKDMWNVFALSVGVNLSFIFALAGFAYEPGVPLTQWNYILHICHDVLGTEMGVFYFAQLVRNYEPKTISSSEA